MIAGEIRYVGKETDRKWEEGDEISNLEFATTEYGRKGKVIAAEEIKIAIRRWRNRTIQTDSRPEQSTHSL